MKKTLLFSSAIFAAILLAGGCSGPKGLPDLDVEEVGCLDGVLFLKLINHGPGPMPEGWSALASIYLDGVHREDILMEKPTSKVEGGLDKPGGVSLYLTPYSIEEIVRADVVLDYTDAVKESHEDDNIRNSLYVAPCSLPDLVVEEVALDENCFVTVRLKNQGNGAVPKKAWSEEFFEYCGLSLYVGDKQWACIPFLAIDPRHALEAAGGSLSFRTELKISGETAVTAIVDSTENLSELEEQNNKSVATLSCKK
jgi:hypothetical protein